MNATVDSNADKAMAISTLIEKLLQDKSGTTAIEYALIIGMVGMVIIGALSSLGFGIGSIWATVDKTFATATTT